MGMAEAVRTCFRKYATFSGRARRPEYWWFLLFVILVEIVLDFVDRALFGVGTPEEPATQIISPLWQLATLVPSLAVGWRRMHDTGRSGLYLLYPLIVMVGIGGYISLFAPVAFYGGDLTRFSGPFGIVLALALLVLVISPLLVLWWLTRPTQPEPNAWGPPPPRSLSTG